MEKKKTNLTAVMIIMVICAIVWNLNLLMDFVYGYSNIVSFVLHIVCAIAYDICAVVWIAQYVKQRTNK